MFIGTEVQNPFQKVHLNSTIHIPFAIHNIWESPILRLWGVHKLKLELREEHASLSSDQIPHRNWSHFVLSCSCACSAQVWLDNSRPQHTVSSDSTHCGLILFFYWVKDLSECLFSAPLFYGLGLHFAVTIKMTHSHSDLFILKLTEANTTQNKKRRCDHSAAASWMNMQMQASWGWCLTGWLDAHNRFTFCKWLWDQAAVSVHLICPFSQTGFADIDTRSACGSVLFSPKTYSCWMKKTAHPTQRCLLFPKSESCQRKNVNNQIPSECISRSNSHSLNLEGTRVGLETDQTSQLTALGKEMKQNLAS